MKETKWYCDWCNKEVDEGWLKGVSMGIPFAYAGDMSGQSAAQIRAVTGDVCKTCAERMLQGVNTIIADCKGVGKE